MRTGLELITPTVVSCHCWYTARPMRMNLVLAVLAACLLGHAAAACGPEPLPAFANPPDAGAGFFDDDDGGTRAPDAGGR